jgi:hypothetical protein
MLFGQRQRARPLSTQPRPVTGVVMVAVKVTDSLRITNG